MWVGVGVIVWVRRGVSGWDSLDCSSPLSVCVCLCMSVAVGVAVIVWGECVGVTVSVCV